MATYYAERSDAEDTEVYCKDGTASFTLTEASQLGYLEVVQSLIGRGADVNESYDWGYTPGYTPLYMASREGHLEVVRALLAAGADVNRSDNDGDTPLSRALWDYHTQVADLLRDAGAHDPVAGGAGAHEASDEEPSDGESSAEGSSEEEA